METTKKRWLTPEELVVCDEEGQLVTDNLPVFSSDRACSLINHILDNPLKDKYDSSDLMFDCLERTRLMEKYEEEIKTLNEKIWLLNQCISLLKEQNSKDIDKIKALEQ